MIEMYTIYTDEVDDIQSAVSKILSGVADCVLLENSVGILHCHEDFLESGIARAVCRVLPFDVAGGVTISASIEGFMGRCVLTLTILTSDDVRFKSGVSSSIIDDFEGSLGRLYRDISSGGGERPAMFIPFLPMTPLIGGDEIIARLDELSRGVPAFGMVAVSGQLRHTRNFAIHNGEAYSDSMALIALFGDVDPYFLAVPVDYGSVLPQKAIVTGIDRNILKSVNNISPVAFFESLNIINNGDIAGLESMPLVFQPEDGGPFIVRSITDAAPDGHMTLTGTVPERSTLALSVIDPEHVARSTEDKIWEALAVTNGRSVMMYSCAVRYWALGLDWAGEHRKAAECIGKSSRYHLAYSAGEIFPARTGDGKMANELLNGSMIICVL